MTTTRTATPTDMVLAWCLTSGSTRSRGESEIKNQPVPVGLVDPIFHRDGWPENDGWHSAGDILNQGAMGGMKAYLADRGLELPASTAAAWERTIARQEAKRAVEEEIHRRLKAAWDTGVETSYDFAQALDGLADEFVVDSHDA